MIFVGLQFISSLMSQHLKKENPHEPSTSQSKIWNPRPDCGILLDYRH